MNGSMRLVRAVRRLLPLCVFFTLAAASSSPASAGVGVWTTHGPDGASVRAVAVDPANPATVYAGTASGGVFKSTNGGASWSAANSGLASTGVAALAIDPSSTATLYAAGGDEGGVFKSTDGGARWAAINSGLSATSTRALAIDPSTPTTLYVGTDVGVFKSTDGGRELGLRQRRPFHVHPCPGHRSVGACHALRRERRRLQEHRRRSELDADRVHQQR